jgi:hypothetical protein
LSDQRITQLPALPAASTAATDVLPVADVSASQTKKITVKDLVDAGLDVVDANSIDLSKLDQASATKLGTNALAAGAVTAAKLAADSTIAVESTAPTTDNFEGRGYLNSTTNKLQVFKAGAYTDIVPELVNGSVTTAKLADGAVTTAKASNLGTAALADDAVTYAKIQNVSGTDKLLGRSTAGAGDVEEIPCTAAGRALLDDANAAAQRATLGLGTLATQNGTFSGTHSGTTSGTNTGDQTITLTGDVTGSGTGSFAATISNGAVSEAKLASNAVSTTKIVDEAVTAAKLADNSAIIVSNATPSGSGTFVGQQWLNTATGLEYTWTGSTWQRQAAVNTLTVSDASPLSFSVNYPDNFSANINISLDTQPANRVWAGPTSGSDATPTFRALQPSDLPDATSSTKGIVQPGTGLSVTGGTLNHTNTTTAGTYPKVTVDAQGHVTAGSALAASDIPELPASKITTGTFSTDFIANDAINGAKLANYSTAKFGEALPTADFIGQIFFNPLDESFFLWDGNVWQPLGISAGSVIFAGTYNATTNQIATVTTEGASIGLTVGNALPSASSSNNSYYVVVSIGGTGTAPAPTVSLAPPDLILSNGTIWTEIDVSSTFVAQSANNVSFTPGANVSATNVQAAIEEVSNETRNADNITGGTLVAARGGTGNTSYTKGDLLAASGATALSKLGVGTNGQVLRANSATATGLEWGNDFVGTVTSVSGSGAISVSNGTTTPAISVASASTSTAGVVQLSDSTSTTSSSVAATSTAVKSAYDLANAALPKTGGTVTGNINLDTNVSLVFEGTTADAFETTLSAVDPTADRTITLPNVSGTVVTTGDTGTVTGTMIADNTIVNAEIASNAAIAYSKLALTGSIVNADIATGAAIVDTKLATISTAGKVANSATTAASANTASAIVARDASGNFSAGTITAALSGNASTATALQTGRTIQGVTFDGTANITVLTAGTGISVSGTAVTNTGVLSVNGSTGAVSNVAVTNTAQSFSAAQRGTVSALTDGATITPDFAVANNFSVTLAGNRTLANPSNLTAGQTGTIVITQDATGSRTLAYGSNWKFPGGTAPTLTTTANAVDVISYYVESATRITARLISDVK